MFYRTSDVYAWATRGFNRKKNKKKYIDISTYAQERVS